ncbi:DUF4255 domain-containing protein [Sorangium sp. So ce375]|uniref:DUF4255 domain-containing protein n=1 Tax=Sorangium sp. So ce375 TaxID=3133306 RepID=UPI003F5C7059
MFHDLDSTLAELLKRELSPALVEQVSISFATPDGQFPPSTVPLPAIDLFLYEINENRDLRSHEPEMERLSGGRVVRTPAPARVDCHYLITAWAKVGVQQPEQDEHRLLGEVMRVLLRHKEIPREALRGSLKAQPLPVRARVSPPSNQQSRGDFWQALGGKPKAAFHYTLTIAMDVKEPEDAGSVGFTSGG